MVSTEPLVLSKVAAVLPSDEVRPKVTRGGFVLRASQELPCPLPHVHPDTRLPPQVVRGPAVHPVLLHRLHALPLLHLRVPGGGGLPLTCLRQLLHPHGTDLAPSWSSFHQLPAIKTRANLCC